MDDLKVTKLKFHDFCEHQGWLLLYDKITDKGSMVGYLLQNGIGIIGRFDLSGEFVLMVDATNAEINVEESGGAKSNWEEDE